MPTKKKEKIINRKCLVCGKAMRIKFDRKGHYSRGHYFGEFELPVGKGEWKETGSAKIGKSKYPVVKWTGKKKVEYWECNECFEEALHETWLEEKIEELFGKRCKDRESSCPTCEAWAVYDIIRDDNRGKL